ncbi:MAG: hypothetical protein LBS04_05425 [Tannerellaceae bacterium]|jgi:hypothetical protein|nr:hypothetical protein [Tannerellaceae bacterium]
MFQKTLIILSVIPILFAAFATETNGANMYLTNTVLAVSAVIICVLLFRKELTIEVNIFDFIIPALLVYVFVVKSSNIRFMSCVPWVYPFLGILRLNGLIAIWGTTGVVLGITMEDIFRWKISGGQSAGFC